MKYICESCGELFEEEDLDFGGEKQYEYVDKGCCVVPYFVGYSHEDLTCSCGGRIVEAKKCDICNKYAHIKYNEYSVCVCEDCVEKYKTTELALRVGDYRHKKVDINEYIARVLTEEEINEVLWEYVKDISPLKSYEATKYLNKPENEEHFKEELFQFLEEEEENQNN